MHCSNVDVTQVTVLNDYNLYLYFDDGSQGHVDISALVPFKGVFEPLKDKEFFSTVAVNHDIGTICWKNGADLSPNFLRENIR